VVHTSSHVLDYPACVFHKFYQREDTKFGGRTEKLETIMKYKHVLVTGGAGFIGSHLADVLLREKRHVRILIRKRKYTPIEKDTLRQIKKRGGEIVYGDLRNLNSLYPAVKNIECVFHLGAVSRPMKILSSEYYDNSAFGTKNILIAGQKTGIRKFIHVSTVSVLGTSPDGHALSEEDYQPTDLTYATSKLVGEKLATEYCGRFHIPIVVIRPVSGAVDHV
jgi:nucleoside-diphosphate-sugar epimerase